MRVYALYFRNRWVLGIVVLEFTGGILVACVSAVVDDRKGMRVNFVVGYHETVTQIDRHRYTAAVGPLLVLSGTPPLYE